MLQDVGLDSVFWLVSYCDTNLFILINADLTVVTFLKYEENKKGRQIGGKRYSHQTDALKGLLWEFKEEKIIWMSGFQKGHQPEISENRGSTPDSSGEPFICIYETSDCF